jgi:hypothetical protein
MLDVAMGTGRPQSTSQSDVPDDPNETVNQFDSVFDKPSRHVGLLARLGHTGSMRA